MKWAERGGGSVLAAERCFCHVAAEILGGWGGQGRASEEIIDCAFRHYNKPRLLQTWIDQLRTNKLWFRILVYHPPIVGETVYWRQSKKTEFNQTGSKLTVS